jgi:hypothetical protein
MSKLSYFANFIVATPARQKKGKGSNANARQVTLSMALRYKKRRDATPCHSLEAVGARDRPCATLEQFNVQRRRDVVALAIFAQRANHGIHLARFNLAVRHIL